MSNIEIITSKNKNPATINYELNFIRRTTDNYTHEEISDKKIKTITSWRKSQKKFLSALILNILTCGILHLVSKCYPKLYLKLYCNICSPKYSDFFLIEDIYGNFVICYTKKEKNILSIKDFQKMDLLSKSYMCLFPSWNSKHANINITNDNTHNNHNDQFVSINNNPIIRFVYNSRIYEYDEERQAVVPVYLNLEGKTNKNIIDIFNEGLSSQYLTKKMEERFGKNEYKLNIDLISVYFNRIERKLIIYSVLCGCMEVVGKDLFSTVLLLAIIGIYYVSRKAMRYKLLKPYNKNDFTIDGEKSYRPKVKRKYLFKKNNVIPKRKSIKELEKLENFNQDRKSISKNIFNNIYDKAMDEKKDEGYKNYEYAEINNSELLPGDIIYLKEGDYCPCDGIILEDSCIINEIELNEKIEYSFKSFLKYSNDVFDYKTNVRNIILHGMKIVKVFKRYNKNKAYITVLCINTGFNTFKANQLTNITDFYERKEKYHKMYKMLTGQRLFFFISVLVILLLSISITTTIFALKIKEKGFTYILSEESSINDLSFSLIKKANSTQTKAEAAKNMEELKTFSNTEEGKKALIKLIIMKYIFNYFIRLMIKSFMPIYFVILSIILLIFMQNLYKINIMCYEKMRLHHASRINTIFMSKIGVLSNNKYEIEGYHPAYQSSKTSTISVQTYYEEQIKDFGNIILSYYSNINSKNENSVALDNSNKTPNKYSVWFLECLLCCNDLIKIGQYIKGNKIEINFFEKMKWELKIPEDNDLLEHEKYIVFISKSNNFNNHNNNDCLSQNSKGENNNLKDKPTYFGSDKEEKYIYHRIIDLFPQNYYRMKDERNLAYQKLISGFKFYLSNKILKRKSRANTISVINTNNNKIMTDSMKNNPILKDLSNFKCSSYKLRIYKKFITRHSLFSSAIVYNFLLKTLRFMTKGSPEKILPHCLISSLPDDIYKTISNFRKEGYIIIICASKKLDLYSYVDINDENYYMNDLIFCGFISLKNKINKESKKAIKELSNMGCELIMSTGDGALNSIGTGFEVGLLDSNKKLFLLDLDEKRKQIYINNIYRPTSFDFEIYERIEEKKNLIKKPKYIKKIRGTELFATKKNKEDFSNHQIKSPIKQIDTYGINMKNNSINTPKLNKPINIRNKKNTLIKNNLFSRSNSRILLNEGSNNDSFYSSDKTPALSNCPTTKTSDIDSKNNTSYLNNSNRSKTKSNNINNKLTNKKKNQRINPNVYLENQYTFENSKKNLYYNSTIILDLEGEEFEKKEFIKKYFSNIYYFSILSLKELEKDCIFCVSGKAFQFILENKAHTQYSNLLNILLKNVKIFFSMTSQDKSFLIDYYRDLPNKMTCMIGNESNDIDSIMTAHVGITIKKPNNENMILCHFYLPSKNLMKVKDLIEHSRAVVENNFLLYFSSLFCTTIIETFIGYSFIKSKDVNPGLLRIINIFFYFLSLFGFTNSVDNSSNNNLKRNSHLFPRYIIVHIIGNAIIKTYAIAFFFYLYRENSLIEESRRNIIYSSYYAILTMNLIFTTLFGFNFVRFYRKSIIDNYMFLFTLIVFMILILINTCLSKVGLATLFTQYFSFENLKSKSDTFDDRNKLVMFGIIALDLSSTIIFIIVIQFIFNRKADNNVKKENKNRF